MAKTNSAVSFLQPSKLQRKHIKRDGCIIGRPSPTLAAIDFDSLRSPVRPTDGRRNHRVHNIITYTYDDDENI
jgi:hypothetical protein